MTVNGVFLDSEGKHLERAGRVAGAPDLVAYDRHGYLGLWYLPIETDSARRGGRGVETPRVIQIAKGELPVEAFNRTLATTEFLEMILREVVLSEECCLKLPIWRKGSKTGLTEEIRLVLGHGFRARGIHTRGGEVMMFCTSAVPGEEPRLCLNADEMIFRGDFGRYSEDLRKDLIADFARLWPAMMTRNYPAGCSVQGRLHAHQALRFIMLMEMSEITTAHEVMDEEARYQELSS